MRVLLLSAYAAQSHVYWHETLVSMFPSWDWRILTMPPRHFSWRMRGNALYWSINESAALASDYDFLIATSMVDLATLRGLAPRLCTVPSILYFHENQFAYPQSREGKDRMLLEAQMVSLYSALAADRIVFNSGYNQDSFFDGCEALLKRLPDKVPAGIVPTLQAKSQVLPVPLRPCADAAPEWPGMQGGPGHRPCRLLWIGRFEHDKGGDKLLRILELLEEHAFGFELAVVGQQFRNSPDAFARIESGFKHRLVQFGYLESRRDYDAVLSAADIVLSTALHEFQGLAVLEAVAAGCVPAVPDRLAYPELFPPVCRYSSHPGDSGREAADAAALIMDLGLKIASGKCDIPDVSGFASTVLAPLYEELFRSL